MINILGVFIGPQIRKLMSNDEFPNLLSEVELRAFNSFKAICNQFLGNQRSSNYKDVVDEFLNAYHTMDCNMSIKIHYIHSHLDFFPSNLGQFSDEHGERFHQEMMKIEKRYEGKDKIHMLADYCWFLKRDVSSNHKRSRLQNYF